MVGVAHGMVKFMIITTAPLPGCTRNWGKRNHYKSILPTAKPELLWSMNLRIEIETSGQSNIAFAWARISPSL
jgi:hypothetical protein